MLALFFSISRSTNRQVRVYKFHYVTIGIECIIPYDPINLSAFITGYTIVYDEENFVILLLGSYICICKHFPPQRNFLRILYDERFLPQ